MSGVMHLDTLDDLLAEAARTPRDVIEVEADLHGPAWRESSLRRVVEAAAADHRVLSGVTTKPKGILRRVFVVRFEGEAQEVVAALTQLRRTFHGRLY